jgi:Winged helix DNA-binding domain
VVHAPESAAWRSPISPRFVALDGVVLPDPAQARVELVRRYLGAFGPATRADIADWSGLRVRDFAPALDALEPLRRFRDERGRELLDLARAPLPPGEVPAPVRFLPKWDSVLLAHADRRRVLPEEYRKAVIATNGDVARSFLVDGVVAGTWSVAKGRVGIEPFAPLPRSVKGALSDEAARLGSFVARNTGTGAVGSQPKGEEGVDR